jgi:hypothetical protein
MKATQKQKRFSSTMRVASFIAKQEFKLALVEIDKYLDTATISNKKRASYLIDLISQPVIAELFTSHLHNKSPEESKCFCDNMLCYSFTHITTRKWRNIFIPFLESLPIECMQQISHIISRLYENRKIPLDRLLKICYILSTINNKDISCAIYTSLKIDSEFAALFLEIISTKKAMSDGNRKKNIMILSNIMMNSHNLSTFCIQINEVLLKTEKHLEIIKDSGDQPESIEYIAQARRMVQFFPAPEQQAVLCYLKHFDSPANNALAATEILYSQTVVENNNTIVDFHSLPLVLDNAYIDPQIRHDLMGLLMCTYEMLRKTQFPEQSLSWRKFSLCAFSKTSSFQSKQIWLCHAETKPFETLDIFLTIYTKWENLIPSTSPLLLLLLDSIRHNNQKLESRPNSLTFEGYLRKFNKLFKASIRHTENSKSHNKYILADRLLQVANTQSYGIHNNIPFISYNLYSLFSHKDLRTYFMVCKGGLIRYLSNQGFPNEIIFHFFYRVGIFNHTTFCYEQNSYLISQLSQTDCVLPNNKEFHINLINGINQSVLLNKKQAYFSSIQKPLHSIFSFPLFRQSFSVCKGGLTRFFSSSYFPIDLIVRVFSEAELFGEAGLKHILENKTNIQRISEIDVIAPRTHEFHQAMLAYQRNAIEQFQHL